MILALILFAVTYVLMLRLQQYRPWVALCSAVLFIVLGEAGVYEFSLRAALQAVDYNVLLMMAGTFWLVITGGIALRNPLVTECAAFREAFYEGPHRRLLERIPVRRFTDMNSGLWGSAWFGMRMTA